MSHACISYSYIKIWARSIAQSLSLAPRSFQDLDGTRVMASFSSILYSGVVEKERDIATVSVLKKDPCFALQKERKPAPVTLGKSYQLSVPLAGTLSAPKLDV